MRVLFVTWDSGATDYLPSLFFPIFEALRTHGITVDTLQGSYGTPADVARVRAQAASCGLGYRAFEVSAGERGVRMPWTMGRFARAIALEAERVQADVVMPRAIVPAAACLLAAPLLRGRRMVWDADGLPADERVDFAGWSRSGAPYWAMRSAEWLMVRYARRVMVRTEAAAAILAERGGATTRARTVVVPNGRSAARYERSQHARDEIRRTLGVDARTPVIVSVGTQGPQYLTDLQATIVAAFQEHWPASVAVFLTAQDALVHDALDRAGVSRAQRVVQRVSAEDVPRWLSAADVGLATRMPSFSQRAVSPLKVGEYLLASLPVIATVGVGDLDVQLTDDVAFRLDVSAPVDVASIVTWFASRQADASTGDRARALGVSAFSQEATVAGYQRLLAGD